MDPKHHWNLDHFKQKAAKNALNSEVIRQCHWYFNIISKFHFDLRNLGLLCITEVEIPSS